MDAGARPARPRRGRIHASIASIAAMASIVALTVSGAPAVQADAAGQSREAVISQYQTVLLPALAVPNDWTGSIDGCVQGTTGPAYQQATLTTINYMRGLAGIGPVSFDADYSDKAQAAALLMAAANSLSHRPPPDWPCWSDKAFEGASHSNLARGSAGAEAIVDYMNDGGSNNALAGHRRWILFTGASVMGSGDTNRTNALYVIGSLGYPSGSWSPWPTAGFFPWQLEPAGRWSITLPGANFEDASVTMTANGASVPASRYAPASGYTDGLTWEATLPAPTDRAHPADLNVDVTVSGVRLSDGTTTTHTFTVNLVDASPHTAPSAPELDTVQRNAGGILVEWMPSDDNGGEQLTYVVTATPLGRKAARLSAQQCTTTTANACQITKTVKTVPYRISVIARNSVGDSSASTQVSPAKRR